MGHCSYDGCSATFKDHRWGHSAAVKAGWFLQRDGRAWCPDHIPGWVSTWRKGR